MSVGIDLYIHSLLAQISDLIPNFEIRSLFHTHTPEEIATH